MAVEFYSLVFVATSVRQLVLNSAASSWLSGGTSRVFTVPATDALAMIETARTCSDITAPLTGSNAPLRSR